MCLLLSILVAAGCRERGTKRAGPAPRPEDDGLGDGQVVYDLLHHHPMAHVYQEDALIIEGALPDLAKYTDGGFKATLIPDQSDQGGRRAALSDGVVAVLRFPWGADRGAIDPLGPATAGESSQAREEIALWMRSAEDAGEKAATVLLNERTLANLVLSPAYRCYRIPLPAGRLLQGENQLRLFMRGAGTINGRRSAAAIERVRIGRAMVDGDSSDAPLPPAGPVRSYGIGADARRALVAVRPTRWSYFLVPPEPLQKGLVLRFAFGVQTGLPEARFLVTMQRDGEPARRLWQGRATEGRWQRAEVDLGAALLSNQDGARRSEVQPESRRAALRLDLSVLGKGAIAGPQLQSMRRQDEPVSLSAPGRFGVAALPHAEHLIVITVDALRADRVLSPRAPGAVRALLAGGALVRLTSSGNFALPAHASLLTGTYPRVHGLVRDRGTLPEGLVLLPEALKRAGFATALFSASGYLSDRFGLHRGFDVYRNLVREGVSNSSREILRLARPFIEAQVSAGRRMFLHLSTADPHAPYSPPATYLQVGAGRPYSGPLRPSASAEQLLSIKRGLLKLGPQDRAYLESLYDAEVAQTGETIGLLMEELARLGIAEKTAIVLLSTHGEEFFDHGSVGHGHSLYQELISVPLVLHFPPRIEKGTRAPIGAEMVDVAPTLLHLLGAAVPETMQGQSLLPLLGRQGRPCMPRAMSAQHDQVRSLELGRYKMIISGGDHLQLYDLMDDPGEHRDISMERPIALRALRNVFSLFYAYESRFSKGRFGDANELRAESSELLRM